MPALPKTYYTSDQYLALERAADYKSELVNGQIYAMSGASREHILIATNLIREISTQLKGKPCETYGSDMRVMVSPTGTYTYPDITVACGDPSFEDGHVDTLLNPTVIIEVLSPSTEAYDRGEKFAHYRELASLSDYVLVSQDKALVEHFVRHPDDPDLWAFTAISGLDAVLQLPSIGCHVALSDIYDRVTLPG